jgi:hypothetical protein
LPVFFFPAFPIFLTKNADILHIRNE